MCLFFLCLLLEVYVSTDREISTIYTHVETVGLNVTLLAKLVREVTYVSNKANLVVESVREAWLDADFPLVEVVFHATGVSVLVCETAVHKESEVTSACELVTEVRSEERRVGKE